MAMANTVEQRDDSAWAAGWDGAIGYYNAARQLFGIAACAADGRNPLTGDLLLQRSVPELAGDVPEGVRLVGACPTLRVAACVGRMDAAVGSVADNVLVRAHLNQGQVLPFAQAVVCSGTTTAVLGAQKAGATVAASGSAL